MVAVVVDIKGQGIYNSTERLQIRQRCSICQILLVVTTMWQNCWQFQMIQYVLHHNIIMIWCAQHIPKQRSSKMALASKSITKCLNEFLWSALGTRTSPTKSFQQRVALSNQHTSQNRVDNPHNTYQNSQKLSNVKSQWWGPKQKPSITFQLHRSYW